jgi:hypothetical protein
VYQQLPVREGLIDKAALIEAKFGIALAYDGNQNPLLKKKISKGKNFGRRRQSVMPSATMMMR